MRSRLPTLSVGLTLFALGCGPAPSTAPTAGPAAAPSNTAAADPGPAPEGQSEPPLPESTAPAGKVELLIADWSTVEELIAAHAGQVVVVDIWSTNCAPCLREFPNLVALHRELGDRVACISISTDYDGIPSKPVEQYREKVLQHLTSQQATFQNVLCSQPGPELYDHLQIGSIPAVLVYNSQGERVQIFADPEDGEEFTYAGQIRPLVDSLLPPH